MNTLNEQAIARDVIVIGASAGGIPAVSHLLSLLPNDLPAMIGVVIHRGDKAKSNWSDMFMRKTKLRVMEPSEGEPIVRGVVYLAPSDQHMTWVDGFVRLDRGEKRHHTRPAVDPLFTSAARTYGSRTIGVVLTGGGSDGAQGLLDIWTAGGIAIAQAPDEAEIPSMPRQAIAKDHIGAVLALHEIADALTHVVRGERWPI